MAETGSRNRRWAAALVLALLPLILGALAATGRADDSADARQAARAFVAAVGKADTAAARSYLAPTAADGAQGKFIDALTDMLAAQRKFNDAAAAKFGPEVKRVDPTTQMVAQIDQATVNVSGDTASLVRPGDPTPLKLTKVDGAWKISEIGTPQQLDQSTPLLHTLAKVQTETAREVTDGKFASFAQAKAAIGAKMRAAMTSPTTAPKP